MEELWIVHDEPGARAALVQLARGVAHRVRAGAPSDESFEAEPPPPVVVLGLSGDLEPVLAFAHRHGPRRIDARWLLLAPPSLPAEHVETLFAGLGAIQWRLSPTTAAFRSALAAALAGPGPPPLLERRRRETLERRFERLFSDLDLPLLERIGALGADRVLIRGEAGTGRALLARALHARSSPAGDTFVALPCSAEDTLEPLLVRAAAQRGEATALTLCLEGVDALPPAVQRGLLGRIERGDLLPEDLGVRRLRWLATTSEAAGLDPQLAGVLGALSVRLPPLRERPGALEPFVASVAAQWCAHRDWPDVRFSPQALEVLRLASWPGNFRELEATVVRTLGSGARGPIRAEDLRLNEEVWDGNTPEPLAKFDRGPSAEPVEPAKPAPAVAANRDASPPNGPGAATRVGPGVAGVERLVGAVAHAVRNPLVAIHAFASLLPERFDDPDFRSRFREQVGDEVNQIEAVMEQLTRFAAFGAPRLAPVDVTGLLEGILEERRAEIQKRRLLVLKELDTARPLVAADEAMLRFAIEGLLSRALRWVPERADLFIASKYHPVGPLGEATVRVLMRFFNPIGRRDSSNAVAPAAETDVSEQGTALEFMLAEQLIAAQGGTLRVDTTEADETVVLLDLPAPG